MYPRKFALLIHIEGVDPLVVAKTCRYCPQCEFIIAHQNELESLLAQAYAVMDPAVIGNPYLVLGTIQLKAWRKSSEGSVPFNTLEESIAQFRRYLTLTVEGGGWQPTGVRKGGRSSRGNHRT